jgi:hypothetical protein
LEKEFNIPKIEKYVKIVGFDVSTAVTMKNAVFWDVAPSGFIINRRFVGTWRLQLQGRRNNASEEKYRWLLSVCYFFYHEDGDDTCPETSVYNKPTRCHVPEDSILHSHRCENLKSYNFN